MTAESCQRTGSKCRSSRFGVAGTVVALAAALLVACGGETPTSPRELGQAARPGTGSVTAQNAVPSLNLKTTPRPDTSGEVWTITGLAPLKVKFNLCTSDDADQVLDPNGRELPNGDSLNWQFNFGDPNRYAIGPAGIPSPDPAFNPVTGAFRPDFDHFCRTEHTYEQEGRYIATVSVTDKHLEDQGAGALARRTQRVLVVALGEPSADCIAPSSTPIPSASDPDVCPNGTFATAPYFSGSGLTYTLDWEVCTERRGVAAAGDISSISINPATGLLSYNAGDYCLTVTATNGCGSTAQSFSLSAYCD